MAATHTVSTYEIRTRFSRGQEFLARAGLDSLDALEFTLLTAAVYA